MARSRRKTQPYLILSTVASRAEAKKIANALLHKKLAACVNILPNVESLFRWKGKVDRAKELLLVIKTEARLKVRVERTIRANHSYQVPEVVGWPIAWGHRPYLEWLSQSVVKA